MSTASPPTSPTREGHPGGEPDPSPASNPSSPAAATPARAAARARFAEPAVLVQGAQLQGSPQEDRGPLARGMAAEVGHVWGLLCQQLMQRGALLSIQIASTQVCLLRASLGPSIPPPLQAKQELSPSHHVIWVQKKRLHTCQCSDSVMLQDGPAAWDPAHSPLEAASADLDRLPDRAGEGRRMTASMRRRVAWNPSPFASASAQNVQLGDDSREDGAQDDDTAHLPAVAAQVHLRWGPATVCNMAC